MSQALYENGIQGMYWYRAIHGMDTDSMGFCDLDDDRVQTVGVQVEGLGINPFHLNADRLGYTDLNEGQERFDRAVEAARLFVAAPELLAALEAMLEPTHRCGEDCVMSEPCPVGEQARAAIAKARGGEQ